MALFTDFIPTAGQHIITVTYDEIPLDLEGYPLEIEKY